ncbi:MAG: hypothetical protein L6R48_23730, partial [Planctomycetes bacterium]|nr:hypothetical protein [Planctomycetota bacterium]
VWADRVVVFEAEHDRWIRATFTGDLPEIIDAGVPDDFTVNDPALSAELIEALAPVMGKPLGLAPDSHHATAKPRWNRSGR